MARTLEEIADAQGWDTESLLIHAHGFINRAGFWDDFEAYLEETATEENAQTMESG